MSPASRPDHEVMARMLLANAELVGEVLGAEARPDQTAAIRAIAATRSLGVLVEDTLRVLVGEARAAGSTWAEIGALFGVSRQAAFQRFAAADEPPPDRTRPVRGARGRAAELLAAFRAGDWEAMRAGFDARMRASCSPELLADVRRPLGDFETLGPPVIAVHGGYTVVETPLDTAAGARRARIVLDGDARIAGFFVLTSE